MSSHNSSWKQYLWVVLALTILLRALLLFTALHISGIKAIYAADSQGYIAPIPRMMHGAFATKDGPELQRTPGYPLFLLLTGMADNHPVLSVACQILLAGFSTFLVFQIGMLIFHDAQASLLGAALYAVEPLSILYSVELLSECLFAAILLIFLYFLVRYLSVPTWSFLVWAALAVSATVYVRPASYYLPVCCFGGLLLLPRQLQLSARFWRATTFLMLCVVLIGVWRVRNYVETGYSGFSSIADTNLYFFNAGEVVAQIQHTDFTTELGLLHWQDTAGYLALHPEQKNWSLARQLAYQRHEALRIISENRFLYLKDHLRGMGVVLFHPCATDYMWILGRSPLSSVTSFTAKSGVRGIISALRQAAHDHLLVFSATAVLEILLVMYYVLAMLALPRLAQMKPIAITLGLVVLYFVCVAGGAAGMARYRYPIMPIVALFAGAGLARLLHSRPIKCRD